VTHFNYSVVFKQQNLVDFVWKWKQKNVLIVGVELMSCPSMGQEKIKIVKRVLRNILNVL
jgi:hypothetical protein